MAGSALPDARLEHLAAYLVELALCEYGALHFLPSCIAAAAVLVAQFSLDVPVWSPTLEHYSRYGPADLQVPPLDGIPTYRRAQHLIRINNC
jgi:Cyclin, C-terminal domain